MRQADLFSGSGAGLVAYVDGAARGNPGPSGIGVSLCDAVSGEEVHFISRYIGEGTNNRAEYMALIAALEYAVESGVEGLRVFSDSELMVRQVNGVYRVRDEGLRRLYGRVRDLVSRLRFFSIEHISRDRNSRADGLANEAIDSVVSG